MKRDRMAIGWEAEDYAVVGVPVDESGDELRTWLKRKERNGECRLEWTRHEMLHSDGRVYQDVVIHSTHRDDPQEIANLAFAYLPTHSLTTDAEAKAIEASH